MSEATAVRVRTWRIGGLLKIEIASVRANLLPMVILWGLAGAAPNVEAVLGN